MITVVLRNMSSYGQTKSCDNIFEIREILIVISSSSCFSVTLVMKTSFPQMLLKNLLFVVWDRSFLGIYVNHLKYSQVEIKACCMDLIVN